MKKILIILFLLLSANITTTFADYDFLIKQDWALEENYSSSLDNVKVNSILNFKLLSLWLKDTNNIIQLNFPSWFEYKNYSISQWCEWFKSINIWNNIFNFSYTWKSICDIQINYKILESWNKTIFLNEVIDDKISQINYLTINSTVKNTINYWETIDSNNNWYIDKFKLVFSSDITNENIDWSIFYFWNQIATIETKVENYAILKINDNIYNSWDFPWINITIPSDKNIESVTNLIPNDKASPLLLKINNISTSENISISGKQIIFNFSEKLNISSINWWIIVQKDGINVTWSYSLVNNLMIFNADTDFRSWNYKIIQTDKIIDLSWNKNTNTSSSITLTWPKESSWGGWWGGWGWYICSINLVECNLVNWKYIYTTKANSSCTWWYVWQTCTINEQNNTNSWVTNTWSTVSNSWFINYLIFKWLPINTDINKFYSLDYIYNFYPNFNDLSNNLSKQFDIENIELFASLDNNVNINYISYLNNYIEIFENLDIYLKTKSDTLKIKIKTNINNLTLLNKTLKTVENKYITKTTWKYKIIYKTAYNPALEWLSWFENMVITKLNSLYESKKISSDTYFKAIDNYNMFVLHFSIFKIDWNINSKNKALDYAKEFISIYNIN